MKTAFALLLAIGAAAPAFAGHGPDNDHHKRQNPDEVENRVGHHGQPAPGPNGGPARGPGDDGGRHGDGAFGGAHDWHGPGGATQPAQAPQGAPDFHGGDRGPRPGTPPVANTGAWRDDGHGGQAWHARAGGNTPPDRHDDWRGNAGQGLNGRPSEGDARNWHGGTSAPDRWRGQPDRPGWDRGGPPSGGWHREWRQDQRYDWARFRAYNRDRFRGAPYYAPRGFGYRPWSVGIRVEPWFIGRNYWISDPYYYHLPPPPPGCAWVRYFNDVALVNLYDGTVLDVIPTFFY